MQNHPCDDAYTVPDHKSAKFAGPHVCASGFGWVTGRVCSVPGSGGRVFVPMGFYLHGHLVWTGVAVLPSLVQLVESGSLKLRPVCLFSTSVPGTCFCVFIVSGFVVGGPRYVVPLCYDNMSDFGEWATGDVAAEAPGCRGLLIPGWSSSPPRSEMRVVGSPIENGKYR